ncbi:hypothetical protein LLG90_24525 [Aromatoleum toluclasticum]|uniref:hypothetical protein n=1 Tax=Aromatoleum toluclasticum TaxID=92003 RepID=UPI001D18ED46|nr:hypothetical protein [Aromatoleum toluclasticum]MCC4118529.1 hypothetical protein [Aromatoleum toluclasticum]
MLALFSVSAPLAAFAGLDNPAADMDPFERHGDILPALMLLAIVAGIIKAFSRNELGGLIADVVKSLGWVAGMYLWILLFGVCIFAWIYVFKVFIGSTDISALLALVFGTASGWKIFTFVVDRTSKK